MIKTSRRIDVASLSLLMVTLTSCGFRSDNDSSPNTVVGRGGVLFDNRVQVLNALPNLADGTTCLYLSEFDKTNSPVFGTGDALTSEQQNFLEKAEAAARPVTNYPVSIDLLDRGLAAKDATRAIRGLLLVPAGLVAAYLGFVPLALAVFLSGATVGTVLSAWQAYPFIAGMLGGFGLLNQTTRDLKPRNFGLRLHDAILNNSETPSRANLGVTQAFINVAKSLPPASQLSCPENLTAQHVKPYFNNISEQYNNLSDFDRSDAAQAALTKVKNERGCHFSAVSGDSRLVYSAFPLNADVPSLLLQTYVLKQGIGAQLIAEERLSLQMKSDAGQGSKFVADNERGSIALWITGEAEAKPVTAKLAHKLQSGEYIANQPSIEGTCNLK